MATGLTLSDVGELLIDQKVSQPRQFRKAILESLLSSFRGILLSQFLSFDGQIDPLLKGILLGVGVISILFIDE